MTERIHWRAQVTLAFPPDRRTVQCHGPAVFAATAPYPHSQVITGVSWDFSTIPTLRKAPGSDIWPLAWAADGNLYGAWGDGGGFDGDSNNIGRVSLGFAASAVTVRGNPASWPAETSGAMRRRTPRTARHSAARLTI